MPFCSSVEALPGQLWPTAFPKWDNSGLSLDEQTERNIAHQQISSFVTDGVYFCHGLAQSAKRRAGLFEEAVTETGREAGFSATGE